MTAADRWMEVRPRLDFAPGTSLKVLTRLKGVWGRVASGELMDRGADAGRGDGSSFWFVPVECCFAPFL